MPTTIRHYATSMNDWGLLILRLVVGIVFVMHGGQKLFVKGLPGIAGFLAQAGIQPAGFWAAALTFGELAAGAALIIGVLTRVAALTLTVTMVVAIIAVLSSKGFFLPGYEYALTLLAASFALLLTGPGRWAIDRRLRLEP